MIRYDALFDLLGRYYTCKMLRATMRIPSSLVTLLVLLRSALTARARTHARTHATIRAYVHVT